MNGEAPRIKLFSELLTERRAKFAGHFLRSDNFDPLRQVSYQPNSATECGSSSLISSFGKARLEEPSMKTLTDNTKQFLKQRIAVSAESRLRTPTVSLSCLRPCGHALKKTATATATSTTKTKTLEAAPDEVQKAHDLAGQRKLVTV